MTLPDIVGDVGVACILGTYLAAQTDRMDPRGDAFLVVNGAGTLVLSGANSFSTPTTSRRSSSSARGSRSA